MSPKRDAFTLARKEMLKAISLKYVMESLCLSKESIDE